MKASLLFFALCLMPASGRCDDCAKTPDACSPSAVKATPFMSELKKAVAPAKTAPAVRNEPARSPARRINAPAAVSTRPAAAETPAEPSPSPDAAAAPASVKKEILSKPGWLAAVFLFLGGLYYFLKEGKKRRPRK